MSDRIFGGIGLVIAIFFAWQATLIQTSFISDAVGPKTFPILLAVLLGISSVYFLLKPDPEPDWPRAGRFAEIAFAGLVLLAYGQLLPEIGFVIATALTAGYLAWRLGSKPLEAVIVGVGTSLGIFVIFKLLLGLSLAEGPLGF